MDAFAKRYLHNAVKHAESTLSGNYKSGNNFAKKIEKMNSIILELEDQVTADNIINDIIETYHGLTTSKPLQLRCFQGG